MPRKGRRTPAPDQLTYTADFAWPDRWWVVGSDGKPPRESSRYERARVASLALQNAIRAALIEPSAVREEARAATASAAPPAVDRPDRDAARTPAQRAAAVHVHQQAAMPQEYLEGRTTDPATWMTSPQNLARLAALTHASDGCGRVVEEQADQAKQAPAAEPVSRQQHTTQPDQGRGAGRDR
ncbi:hypothetical protein [Streptomyces sp. NPDC058092]|uniref:hypothetical protein n=1 Tax=Streptomyces sp. NPDC058092 TaxID=3346336 RepID=UPI0036ECDB21